MKKIEYIHLEGIEINQGQLERPDVQAELSRQLGNKKINPECFFLGVITHMYDDTQLPIALDYAFQLKNTARSEHVKITIRGCFNYGTRFHTKFWRGYNHLAIMEIDDPNAEILKIVSPYKTKKRWDPTLILCDSKDATACKSSIESMLREHEAFMKKK